ncbi:MAG: hypothetical protein ACXW1Z_25720 [Methylobacter sp.]|jgi:predicted transcriptional regulator
MITLNQQTEQQLQEIASQTHQSVQQLIELFIQDYQAEQQSIKRADSAYAEYLNSGESLSLQQIKQANDLEN